MNAMLDGLKALGAPRLIAVALVALATLGLFAVLTLHTPGQTMALLYADLDLREAGQIIAQLHQQHIASEVRNGGTEILVPAGEVATTRLLLARQGLPSGGSIGYEIFDRQNAFTASQFEQNINKLRAMEGELSRTIRAISGIRAARVHLALPSREPFARDRPTPQASVVITTVAARPVDHETVLAIVNLVAAAVPGMRPQNVTLIDSRGNLLARAGDAQIGLDGTSKNDQTRYALEMRLSRAVEDMLARTLGPGHVRAEASIDMNFQKTKESLEKFNPDGQVVRSTQTSSDTSQSSDPQTGVSVQNNLPNAAAATTTAGSKEQKRRETTNYEIDKTVRTIITDQPQVSRISIAVMVDGKMGKDAAGKPVWQPLPPADLKNLTELVKAAIGFDAKRGDSVQVISMPFATGPDIPAPPVHRLLGMAINQAQLLPLAQTGLLALTVLVALLLVFRPMILRLTALPAANTERLESNRPAGEARAAIRAAPSLPLLGGPAGSGPDAGSASLEAAAGDESWISLANVDGQLKASALRKLSDLVQKHPDESLSIVRAWMQQGAG
ncbi:MAG: flagellar M-ring protein FliF [Rhodospirillales bacterium]|nr:flagellar M-ring protein FliF [Rhodospirillales bacterium]MDE2198569.1 flagellar M-ring protein FliF [Rhodospirillales bacterium]MDE2575476.1 flagellar M-ring protein FliF [Rhodospirillales bacterium]